MGVLDSFKQSMLGLAFVGYVFFVTGLLVNFFQLLSCVVWPFSKDLYRKINNVCCYIIWSQYTFLGQWWSPSDLKVRMSKEMIRDFVETGDMSKHPSIVILNHKYDIDWLAGYIVTERLGLLGGTKVFAKKILRLFPIQGWAWVFSETIFVSRNWEVDKDRITESLRRLVTYPEGWPVSILMYCEGTRFTPEKQVLSAEFARSKGQEPLKHHLMPRTRGFTHTMQCVGDKIPVIYDCTVAYKDTGAKPTFMNVFKGRRMEAEMHIQRISTADVPKDEEACSKWLHDLYKQKDRRFDEFLANGKFDGEIAPVRRRYIDLFTWAMAAIVTVTPLLRYLYYVFTQGSFWSRVIAAALLLLIGVGMQAVAAVTQASRGSSYGQAKASKTS